MKVTIIVGGRWHTFDFALLLLKGGHLPRLVTNYPRYKTRRWGLPDEHVISLPMSMLLEQSVRRTLGERGFARIQGLVHRIFARQAARYVDGSDIAHGLSGFSLPAIKRAAGQGIPFVVERLSAHILTQSELMTDEADRMGFKLPHTHPDVIQMELAEYETATAISIPSRFVEETFTARGIARSKLYRNTLGVDLAAFSPETSAPRDFRVLYVGSKSLRKGVHYLREGFLQASLPGAQLRLVGGDLPETPLLLGPPHPQIMSIGHMPQARLVDEYRQAAVFVIASIEEGLAMVQAQAMACGLPLICTTNTGGEDLLVATHDGPPPQTNDGIREYAAGFVVPIRSPDAIALCLHRLYVDAALLRAKSVAALNIRHRKLDWQAYTSRGIALYERLLAP
jgi:glycosyltransferase involved in cell wall biosynthesis